MTTKDKIFEAAVNMFNEHGVANVRLQQIAKKQLGYLGLVSQVC